MKQCKHLHCKGRRDFFRKAFFLGAAALFAGAKDRRARLTAHIRRYYERASF
jgi:hypothetical protein